MDPARGKPDEESKARPAYSPPTVTKIEFSSQELAAINSAADPLEAATAIYQKRKKAASN